MSSTPIERRRGGSAALLIGSLALVALVALRDLGRLRALVDAPDLLAN